MCVFFIIVLSEFPLQPWVQVGATREGRVSTVRGVAAARIARALTLGPRDRRRVVRWPWRP